MAAEPTSEVREGAARCIRELLSHHGERDWVEYKENKNDPAMIGRLVSALSNSATLTEQPEGFAVWGVEDRTRRVVGTTFDPWKQENGQFFLRLAQALDPNPLPDFEIAEIDGHRLCLVRVRAAGSRPVRFNGEAYIRIHECVTPLKSHPEFETELFRLLDRTPWETRQAHEYQEPMEALGLLNFQGYFDLISQAMPASLPETMKHLEAACIVRSATARNVITNLGAVLFAHDLSVFGRLRHKKVRVVVYSGKDRSQIARQREFDPGYAVCFKDVIDWINAQLPGNEQIGRAFRTSVPMFPPESLREVIANALIHQDFAIEGARPLVEIFDGRVEVANPGKPLIAPDRFLDHPPRSRNVEIASIMHRMKMCEALGSGIDRVLRAVEFFQLPAPRFERDQDGVRVVLYAHLDYAQMTSDDKVRAVYQHAGLRHVCREGPMTNATLRKRFGMSEDQQSSLSKVIAQAVKEGLIKRHPPESTSKKHAQYLPIWA